MKNILILLSILLLSSFLTSCEEKNSHETEIYIDGSTSYWIDTRTGCHYLLPNNQPRIDELGKIVCDSDLRI